MSKEIDTILENEEDIAYTNFSLVDEEGNMRPKQEVLEQMSKLYDEIEKNQTSDGTAYLAKIVKPDSHIDIASALETDKFLSRKIYLNGEIDDEAAQYVHHMIYLFNEADDDDGIPVEERVPISIFINTDGGYLDSGRLIVASIQLSKTPVYTYNIGKAFSAGFWILIAGHKRFGLPFSSYLFHEGSISISDKTYDFFNLTKYYRQELDELKQFTLEHTKITEEQYEKEQKGDMWFGTKTALELGVIDKIADSIYMEV